MECEINGNEVSCVVCTSFKTAIDVVKIVEKIAQILGLPKVTYLGDGIYSLGNDEVEVKCEWKELSDVSFSDYCIRCYTV